MIILLFKKNNRFRLFILALAADSIEDQLGLDHLKVVSLDDLLGNRLQTTHFITIDNPLAAFANQVRMRIGFIAIEVAVVMQINLQHFALFFKQHQGLIDGSQADRRKLQA